jgi:type II secretory pathway pseudopilin PulG
MQRAGSCALPGLACIGLLAASLLRGLQRSIVEQASIRAAKKQVGGW